MRCLRCTCSAQTPRRSHIFVQSHRERLPTFRHIEGRRASKISGEDPNRTHSHNLPPSAIQKISLEVGLMDNSSKPTTGDLIIMSQEFLEIVGLLWDRLARHRLRTAASSSTSFCSHNSEREEIHIDPIKPKQSTNSSTTFIFQPWVCTKKKTLAP